MDEKVPVTSSALYLVALAAGVVAGSRGPVYWDTFGYVQQAIDGQIGGLGLGRPLFVWISHGITRLLLDAHVSVWMLEPWLRFWWLAVSATVAPATFVLGRHIRLPSRAACAAGIVVALSPAMAHTGAAVLTDGPAAAAGIWTLAAAAAALRYGSLRLASLAGALAAAAFTLREQSLMGLASLPLLCAAAPPGRRLRFAGAMAGAFAVTGGVLMTVVLATQPGYSATIHQWIAAMQQEKDGARSGLRDAGVYALWLMTFGPVAIAAATATYVRRDDGFRVPGTARFAVAFPALVQMLALALYPDISYSPRYLAGVFPCAIALPAGASLARWLTRGRWIRASVSIGLAAPIVIAALIVSNRDAVFRELRDTLPAMLDRVPSDSVITTGRLCPALPLIATEQRFDRDRRMAPARWEPVCPGWSWPASLESRLDDARREGRTVVLDLRDRAWAGDEQRRDFALVIDYARRHPAAADPGIIVWR